MLGIKFNHVHKKDHRSVNCCIPSKCNMIEGWHLSDFIALFLFWIIFTWKLHGFKKHNETHHVKKVDCHWTNPGNILKRIIYFLKKAETMYPNINIHYVIKSWSTAYMWPLSILFHFTTAFGVSRKSLTLGLLYIHGYRRYVTDPNAYIVLL